MESDIHRVVLNEAGRTMIGAVVLSEACVGFFFEDTFFTSSLIRLVLPLEAAFPLV